MRPPPTIETRIQRLLRSHQLANITLAIHATGVYAAAVPANYNPEVARRRERAAAARVEAGVASISLADAEQIQVDAMKPIARGNGPKIADALDRLEQELKK